MAFLALDILLFTGKHETGAELIFERIDWHK